MSRYYWILLTYITRPMMWVTALATVTAFVVALVAQSDRYTHYNAPIIVAELPIIDSRSGLSEFAGKSDRVQVRLSRVFSEDRDKLIAQKRRSRTTGSVHLTNEDLAGMVAGLQDFEFPKNVEALTTGGIGSEFKEQIAELENLRRLSFEFSYSGEKFDIAFLSGQKKLEVLELGAIHEVASLVPLQNLPKLHTLAIRHNGIITKERMSEVADIGSLKNLYLTNVAEYALDAVAELENSSSLENIFVATPLRDADHLAQIQSRVPSIRVRSSVYRPYRLLVLVGSIWYALVLGLLGIHFAGQFSMPHAELTPHYRSTHRRFTWGLMGTLILVVCGLVCWLSGAHLLPVLSVFSLAVIAACRSSVSTSLLARMTPSSRMASLVRMACAFTVVGSCFFFMRHPMLLEEFVMGQWPWVVVVLAVLAILFAFDLNRRMNHMCRERYAVGGPLILSIQDLQKASTDRVIVGQEDAQGTVNPHASFERLVRGLGVVAVLLVIVRYFWGDQLFGTRGAGAMLKGQVVFASFFLAFMTILVIGAKWWQRMPFLATMMTRPPNRLAQVNSVLAGVRADFLLQLPLFAVALLILAVNAPFWGSEHMLARLIASALFIAATIYVCYVAVLWGLIVRTIVGLIVLFLILQFGVTMSAGMLTAIGVDFNVGLPAYRVIITAMVMIGFAAFAYRIARRKYFALEWGRLI